MADSRHSPVYLVVLAAGLLLVYLLDVRRQRARQRGGVSRRLLYLTHWNYLLVCALLCAFPFVSRHARADGAVVVCVVSLFVLLARLLFLRGERDVSSYARGWDGLTHVLVPLIPAVLLLACGPPGRVPWVALCLGVGVLELWILVNVAAQAAHPRKKWVYGRAANPLLQQGRFQLLAAFALVLLCGALALLLSKLGHVVSGKRFGLRPWQPHGWRTRA